MPGTAVIVYPRTWTKPIHGPESEQERVVGVVFEENAGLRRRVRELEADQAARILENDRLYRLVVKQDLRIAELLNGDVA